MSDLRAIIEAAEADLWDARMGLEWALPHLQGPIKDGVNEALSSIDKTIAALGGDDA